MEKHHFILVFRANGEVDSLQRRGQTETARLEAMLRKTEMRVTSLETQLKQKQEEGTELTQICDELIAKVGGEDNARGQ